MAFKINLLGDARGFLSMTGDVEKALDDVADSLDDLARDTKQNADEAGRQLERGFSDAFDKVRREGKDTSRRMGDDLKHGAKEAGEGFNELGDEAKDSAKEAAASFSGEFTDVADYIQEVLAQALQGFGPIGAAAGIAAAAGVGILISQLEGATDKANELNAQISEVAEALVTDPGSALTDRISRIRTELLKIPEVDIWGTITGKMPVAEFDRLADAMTKANLAAEQQALIARGIAGDNQAAAQATQMLAARQDELNAQAHRGSTIASNQATANQDVIHSLRGLEGGFGAAADLAERYGTSALGKAIEGTQRQAAAAERAKESNEQFADSLKDAGAVLDDYSDKIINKGKINFAEWRRKQEEAAKANKAILKFDAKAELSDQARENFRQLPRETQEAIAREWGKSKKSKKKIETYLDVDAKADKVTLDTSSAQKKADGNPVEVPTTVKNDGALKGAQEAADAAQKVANRDNNHIEYHTRIDTGELQRQVDRAAASIRPPTITIKTRVQKETP